MKRSIALSGILLPVVVLAQPVLDHRVFPTTGTAFDYHDAPFLQVGKGGMGMQWDYRALPDGGVVRYEWTTTNIEPGAGAFPSDAFVLHVPGEPSTYYWQGDTALYVLGTYIDTALVRFDPPLVMVDLPCAVNMTWSDTGRAAVTGAGRIDIRTASLHAQTDAWGTLAMPYGEVKDVIRIRTELRVTATNDPGRLLMREVTSAWYCDRTPMPLLVIKERTGRPFPLRYTRWLDGSWREGNGTIPRTITLAPFPNPCGDLATVDLPGMGPDHTTVQVLDEKGQMRKQWLVEFTRRQTQRLTLELSDLPSGQYTLTWIGTNGTLGNARLEKE
jgi:hypothetical protein